MANTIVTDSERLGRLESATRALDSEAARWFELFAGGHDHSQAAERLDAALAEVKRASANIAKAASRARKRKQDKRAGSLTDTSVMAGLTQGRHKARPRTKYPGSERAWYLAAPQADFRLPDQLDLRRSIEPECKRPT